MKIIKIEDPQEKSEICEKILRSLPKWFGIESSIVDYIKDVQKMETWAAIADEVVGFVGLNKHNEQTAEIHVMGLLPQYHRQRVGTNLIQAAKDSLVTQGYKYLTVKTLSESRPDENYEKSRQFYLRCGFTPIEEFKTLWGEHNPCLMMIKSLAARKYAVIFSSKRNAQDHEGYEKSSQRMVELAQIQKGFMGVESCRDSQGQGITVSYWRSLDDIKAWRLNSEHMEAQGLGRTRWYESFSIKICIVHKEYKLN